MDRYGRKPAWLRKGIPTGPQYSRVHGLVNRYGLHTVCQEALCPNRPECFHQGTATFLLLGDVCTRNCAFCAVKQGMPYPLRPDEPERLSQAVAELGLSFVVLTSVTRDDIADGGAGHFSFAARALQERDPGVMVEVLIPDFSGSTEALARVLEARPAVLNHNVETVPRLYAGIRPRADYQQSLKVLERAAQYSPRPVVKSGLMLGLGENTEEIVRVMEDLLARGCDVLTLGQYLQPRPDKAPVARFVSPEEFNSLREEGLSMGFAEVVAGPYVRSSFQARNAFLAARRRSIRKGNAHPLSGPPRPSRK